MTEIWKAVPGYEGAYEVSDLGRVRSLDRLDSLRRPLLGALKTPTKEKNGYWRVGLCRGARRRSFNVHCLVLAAFVSPRPPGCEGLHNDGDQDNNRRDNLRWGTPSENSADREAHGKTAKGERSGVAILTDAAVTSIRAEQGLTSRAGLAARYGVGVSSIARAQRRETWRHV